MSDHQTDKTQSKTTAAAFSPEQIITPGIVIVAIMGLLFYFHWLLTAPPGPKFTPFPPASISPVLAEDILAEVQPTFDDLIEQIAELPGVEVERFSFDVAYRCGLNSAGIQYNSAKYTVKMDWAQLRTLVRQATPSWNHDWCSAADDTTLNDCTPRWFLNGEFQAYIKVDASFLASTPGQTVFFGYANITLWLAGCNATNRTDWSSLPVLPPSIITPTVTPGNPTASPPPADSIPPTQRPT